MYKQMAGEETHACTGVSSGMYMCTCAHVNMYNVYMMAGKKH